jgi:hypothetical protein
MILWNLRGFIKVLVGVDEWDAVVIAKECLGQGAYSGNFI